MLRYGTSSIGLRYFWLQNVCRRCTVTLSIRNQSTEWTVPPGTVAVAMWAESAVAAGTWAAEEVGPPHLDLWSPADLWSPCDLWSLPSLPGTEAVDHSHFHRLAMGFATAKQRSWLKDRGSNVFWEIIQLPKIKNQRLTVKDHLQVGVSGPFSFVSVDAVLGPVDEVVSS